MNNLSLPSWSHAEHIYRCDAGEVGVVVSRSENQHAHTDGRLSVAPWEECGASCVHEKDKTMESDVNSSRPWTYAPVSSRLEQIGVSLVSHLVREQCSVSVMWSGFFHCFAFRPSSSPLVLWRCCPLLQQQEPVNVTQKKKKEIKSAGYFCSCSKPRRPKYSLRQWGSGTWPIWTSHTHTTSY